MNVEIVNTKIAYQGFFKIEKYRLRHSLFGGGMSADIEREMFRRGDSAGVLLYDPELDNVVLLEQFRIGAVEDPRGSWLFEIVAGMVEPGETPQEVVRREAREEAGCAVEELMPISTYYASPGGSDERISLFCGKVDTRGLEGVFGVADESEDIKLHVASFEEAMSMVESGVIRAAMPILALQWLALNKDKVLSLWTD